MVLTAVHKDTGEPLCPVQIQYRTKANRSALVIRFREESNKNLLLCPHCKKLGFDSFVGIVDTQGKRLHFRHKPNQPNKGHCPGASKSDEHISIQAEFGLELERIEGGQVIQEYQGLPDRVRIPDILHIAEDGFKTVYEVQLSPIKVNVLAERTRDYQRHGLKVVWMLGKKALSNSNKEWCAKNLGGYAQITDLEEGATA